MNNENNNIGNQIPNDNQNTHEQPNYQNHNQNNLGQSNNNGNKRSNIGRNLLIGLLSFIIVGGLTYAIMSFVLPSNKTKKNEYEEPTPPIEVPDSEDPDPAQETKTITFKGFKFNKLSEYTYEIEGDELNIYNNNYNVSLSINEYDFDAIKPKYNEVANELNKRGFTTNNPRLQTVSEKEVITCEISNNGISAIYFIVGSPKNKNYTFEGVVMNRDISINNDDLSEVINIINNSEYVGNYSDYAKDFSYDFKLEN